MCNLFSCCLCKRRRVSPQDQHTEPYMENPELPKVVRRSKNSTSYIQANLEERESPKGVAPTDMEQVLRFGLQTASMLDNAIKLTQSSIRSLSFNKEMENLSKEFTDISGPNAKERLQEQIKGRSALGSYIWLFCFSLRFCENVFAPYNQILFKEETQELFDEFICLVKRIFDMTIFVTEFIVEEKARFHKILRRVHFPSEMISDEAEEAARKRRNAYQWIYPLNYSSEPNLRKLRILTTSRGFKGRAFLQDLNHERDIENIFREISLRIYESLWDNLGYGLSLLRICRGNEGVHETKDSPHSRHPHGHKSNPTPTSNPNLEEYDSAYEEIHLPTIAKISEGLRIIERYVLALRHVPHQNATPSESASRHPTDSNSQTYQLPNPGATTITPEDRVINEVLLIISDKLDLLEYQLFNLRLLLQDTRHTMHYSYEMTRKRQKWAKGPFSEYYVDKNFNISHGKKLRLISCPPCRFRFGKSVLGQAQNNLQILEVPLTWQEATNEFNSSLFARILKILPVKAGPFYLFLKQFEPIFDKKSVNELIREKEMRELKKRKRKEKAGVKINEDEDEDSSTTSEDEEEEEETSPTTTATDTNKPSTNLQ